MKRREFLQTTIAGGFAGIQIANAQATPAAGSLRGAEASIDDLQTAQSSGKETAVSLTRSFLRRIEELDRRGPALRSVIELNPDALTIARALDAERKLKGARGPLHGMPVLVKDNLDTGDRMLTTAGSLALDGSRASEDAFVVRRLRDAGAVILGKTNLSEWANFRGSRSTSGWSARGGQTHHPYALDRNPSGSSSGSAVAVAAGLCVGAIGTETDGSIVSPAAVCGVVGLKPTVGLLSRTGIIPISQSQDTPGPMTRTVRDAAHMLGALTGIDPRDPASPASEGRFEKDYSRFLDPDGLRGARLGVLRSFFSSNSPGNRPLRAALEALKTGGAELVELHGPYAWDGLGDAEYEVMLFEFKAGLNAYLGSLGPSVAVHSLAEVIAFNERNRPRELIHFGQEHLERAEAKGPLTDPKYLDALAKCRRLARTEGIDALMDQHRLDALVAPAGGPAGKTDWVLGDRGVGGGSSPAAVAGYPNITVPAGDVRGLPVGISFFGRAYSEPVLLRIAYGFERATRARIAPRFLPTLG